MLGGGGGIGKMCWTTSGNYSDLIDGFIKTMDTDQSKTPINLGNPREFTILELAEFIMKKVNSKSSISFNDLPSDDPKQRRPDISYAVSKLNWRPSIDIEEGLDATINYFKSIL